MGKSSQRRSKGYNIFWIRSIGNQKYKKMPGIRPGARPPDSWDDYRTCDEHYKPRKVFQKMWDSGRWDEETIVRKIHKKWRIPKSEVVRWITEEKRSESLIRVSGEKRFWWSDMTLEERQAYREEQRLKEREHSLLFLLEMDRRDRKECEIRWTQEIQEELIRKGLEPFESDDPEDQ